MITSLLMKAIMVFRNREAYCYNCEWQGMANQVVDGCCPHCGQRGSIEIT